MSPTLKTWSMQDTFLLTAAISMLATYYSTVLLHPQFGSPMLLPLVAEQVNSYGQITQEVHSVLSQAVHMFHKLTKPTKDLPHTLRIPVTCFLLGPSM